MIILRKTLIIQLQTGCLFSGFGSLRAALGISQLKQYQQIVTKRNRNAALFAEDSRCVSWYVGSNVEPCWLKQKVILPDIDKVRCMSGCLQKKGLRVGVFNWGTTIDGYLGKPERPNAKYVAQHGLDIPIHQNMLPEQCAEIREEICFQ